MATKVIQMMEKTADGYDELILLDRGIVFRVNSTAGTSVTCTFNGIQQSYTFTEDGLHDFYGSTYGTYNFIATKGVATKSFTQEVSESKIYNMSMLLVDGIIFRVTSLSGTTISCSFEGEVQTYTYASDGTHDFYGNGFGTYNFTAEKSGISTTYTQQVNEAKIYNIELEALNSVLDKNSWNIISQASNLNIGANVWSLGDTKMITVNGSIAGGTFNGSYGVFIASFSHNPTVEGSGILFHSFKNSLEEKKDIALYATFQMNTSSITDGGWRDCYMRNTIIPQFENAISTDLKNVVKTSTIYSHNYTGGSQNNNASHVTATQDKFYLLAEFEIFGSRSYASSYEQNRQVQVEYYKLGNSRIKYQSTNPSSAYAWWERSVYCSDAGTNVFCIVSYNGGASIDSAASSLGFAVAFRV